MGRSYRECDVCSKQRRRFKKADSKRVRTQLRLLANTGYEPTYRDRHFRSQYQSLKVEKEADATFHKRLRSGRSASTGRCVLPTEHRVEFDNQRDLMTAFYIDQLGRDTVEAIIGRPLG